MRAYCVICTDLFDGIESVLAAPCGHTFHCKCLTSWLNQSKTCPKCRVQVTTKNVLRLFFSLHSGDVHNTNTCFENEIENLKSLLLAKDIELEKFRKEKETLQLYVAQAESETENFRQLNYKNENEISVLKLKVKTLSQFKEKVQKLEQRNCALENDLEHLNHVQLIVSGSQKDIDDIIENSGTSPNAVKQLATYCTILKRELSQVIDSKCEIKNELISVKKQLGLKIHELKRLKEEIKILQEQLLHKSVENTSFSNSRLFCNISPANNSSCTPVQKAANSVNIEITPITGPLEHKRKAKMNIVVNKDSAPSCSIGPSMSSRVVETSLAVRYKKTDETSVVRTGYNGFGGHSTVIVQDKSLLKCKSSQKKFKCN